jgi:hypothetical protein
VTTESIIDTTKPSAGRIYDFMLGGHHNFEVDRAAASQISALLPFLPKAMRMQRWCLQDLALELTEKRGYDIIIDFASGLPTNDHIHHVVPKGTTVIYSDYDPVVVEYAREILADTADVHFFHGDARRPDELLNRPGVEEILAGRRNVAIVYWGIAAFLGKEDISYAARFLYDWSGPEACFTYLAQGAGINADDANMANTMKLYAQMGTPLQFHSLQDTLQMLHPWRLDDHGFIDFLNWHSLSRDTLAQDDLEAFGAAGGASGAYLVK